MTKIVGIKLDYQGERVEFTDESGASHVHPFYSEDTFREISKLWVKIGWGLKYSYNFTWLGRPILQLPEDVLRIQEVIYRVQPDVIIETGVAHGGSLIFYSSLCKTLGKGRVIGVDIEIRPHNRTAIESHFLASYITLIEGSSVDAGVVSRVKALVNPNEKVLVALDSSHTKEHVLAELNAYAPMVTPGSYVVATDGIMEQLVGAPRSHPDWAWNNPRQAAVEYAAGHPEFIIEEPPLLFNESMLSSRVTYWPEAYLRRVRA